MNVVEVSLFILFLAAVSSRIVERLHLPVEVFLLLGSCAISLIPGVPPFEMEPTFAFALFLPPILFHAAYFTSWRDFKKNRRPIAYLAIGLVLFTASTVAIAAKFLFPDFTWAEGFLLGAIVSPPDASAATSIVKKFGAPRRLITVLEGESLVNDATALIIYRFALAAILIGSFSIKTALWQFVFISIGGLGVGLIVSRFFMAIIQKTVDTHAQTILSVITAFACYIIAERIGVSGIISTVAGGLYFSRRIPIMISGQARQETLATWRNLIFVINGFIFTLIGFQFPLVIRTLEPYHWPTILFYGLTISTLVILTRFIWIFVATYLPVIILPKSWHPSLQPQWKIAAALGWIGMRGIVSLAAVMAVPLFLPDGRLFPDRGMLLFITYSVILVTLTVPSLTVPALLKTFHIKSGQEKIREEAMARVLCLEGSLNKLNSWTGHTLFSESLIIDLKKQINRKLNTIRPQMANISFSEINEEYFSLRLATRELIEIERAVLLQLRHDGKIHDEVFHLLSDELDLEEIRSKTLRI